jgi:hypothetical protein
MTFWHSISHWLGLNSKCYRFEPIGSNRDVFGFIECNECGLRYNIRLLFKESKPVLLHPYRSSHKW